MSCWIWVLGSKLLSPIKQQLLLTSKSSPQSLFLMSSFKMKDGAMAAGPTQPPQLAERCAPHNSGFSSQARAHQPSSPPATYSVPSKRSLALQMLRDRERACGKQRPERVDRVQGKRAKRRNGKAKEEGAEGGTEGNQRVPSQKGAKGWLASGAKHEA